MLRKLGAFDSRFKTFQFKEGLNMIVADVTPKSLNTDSRNSAGKSSIVELIHFLLGARADTKQIARRKALRDVVFFLDLDWPEVRPWLQVRRSGKDAGFV